MHRRPTSARRVPEQMFGLACEGINRSSRHLALRCPRIAHWRSDEPAHRLAKEQAPLPEAVRAKQV